MRAVIQRVNRVAVRVDGEVVGEFTRPGLMVLVGATHDDGPKQVATGRFGAHMAIDMEADGQATILIEAE